MRFLKTKVRVADLFLFGVLNMPLSLLIMWPLFQRATAEAGGLSASGVLMFVASAAALNLLYVAVLWLLALARLPRVGVVVVAVIAASALQLFLVADVRVFSFFKFHINGLILNFLTTEGAGDSLQLGSATLATFAGVIAVVVAAEVWLARRVWFADGRWDRVRRRIVPVGLALVVLVVLDKAVYAYADLTNEAAIMSSTRFFLLSGGVTVKHFAERWVGYKVNREKDINLAKSGKSLNYPRQPLTLRADGPRYNVVFMLADGFRYDMLNPEVTPHLCEFARKHLTFQNHFSGGNGTRFGVFSMMYGLYANLWHPFWRRDKGRC